MLYAGRPLDAISPFAEADDTVRQYLEEALGQEEAERAAGGGIAAGEKIDHASLEGKGITVKQIFLFKG